MILCDIGNSNYDFLIENQHKKYLTSENIPKFDDKIFYISVNQKATQKLLDTNPTAVDIASFVEFKTEYKGMGIDRKVVCSFATDCIIVDAGSAITVDIVESGVHQGGFILLGIQNHSKSYQKVSEVLKFDFENEINLDKIPLCTKDAINYAILKSIILPIKELAEDKKILFTGGDGEFLSSFFSNSHYKKDLIFENMKRIINANSSLT